MTPATYDLTDSGDMLTAGAAAASASCVGKKCKKEYFTRAPGLLQVLIFTSPNH
jgi:hypothetical protein